MNQNDKAINEHDVVVYKIAKINEQRDLSSKKQKGQTFRFYKDNYFKDIYFTPREWQCAVGLSVGKKAWEIAQDLKLSKRTIEFYVKKVKSKIGLKKLSEVRIVLSQCITSLVNDKQA